MLLTTPLLSMDKKGSSKLYRKFQNLNDHVPYKACDALRNKLDIRIDSFISSRSFSRQDSKYKDTYLNS